MNEPKFFGERYELGEPLGQGGMAEVRIGVDRRLGRTVAVKVLRNDLANDPTFQARFRREAQSAAALNHPAIVAVYDTGEEMVDGVPVPYIVMEYVEGRTLRDVLKEGRRILPERALEITADVLEALEYSHRAGIVHRDIKPGNVMLTPTGDVKVMDFGIARAVADASATMTQTAAVIGTAQYLSPEQARGETVDARSDIYSTGCLLFELLTGRPPFVGDSPVSVAYQHVREEAQPPSALDPEVSREADAIALQSLQKRPMDRYQTADEMRGDLVRALSGQRVATAAPVGPPPDATSAFGPVEQPAAGYPPPPPNQQGAWGEEPGEPERRSRKGLWIGLSVAIVVALVAAGFLLVRVLWTGTESVPNVVGESQQAAKAAITEAGFEVEVKKSANAQYEKGKVFEQKPEGGNEEEPGTKIRIGVSTGPPTDTIPNNLVGQKRGEVERLLRSKGFEVDFSKNKESDEPKGQVLAVDPGEGSEVPPNSGVEVEVSAGFVELQDVRQQEADTAKALLESDGFDVTVEEQEHDGDPGVVFDQEPNGSSRAPRGSEVTLYVPKEQELPNLAMEAVANPASVSYGDTSTLDLTITNNGEGPSAEGATLEVQLPEGVTPEVQDGCTVEGTTVSCTLPAVEPGTPATVSIPLTIEEGAPVGSQTGSASVEAENEEDTSDNSAEFSLQISPI